MAAYRKWGVDIAIDLEHQMLDQHLGADPTARDARGWCKLDVRPDGSLWAVDVKWTRDGAERLAEKRQRYVSPAFGADQETKRVTQVLNIAITAMPATHETPALVAATARGTMDAALVQKAIDALVNEDSKAALDILKGLIVSAAGGDSAPEEPAAEVPEVPVIEESATPPTTEEDEEKKKEAVVTSRLLRATGRENIVEALADLDVFRASHLELETKRQELATERAVLDTAERRKGCVDLVRLAGRAPATVWADAFDKSSAPKKYLADMPLADFRDYVSDAIKANAGRREIRPPTGKTAVTKDASSAPSATPTYGLTPEQLVFCKEAGCDPAVFARLKSR